MTTTLIGERREGNGSVSMSNNSLVFKDTYNFLVVSSYKQETRENVLTQTVGLPIVGIIYGPLGLKCVNLSATRKPENVYYWEVKAEFESGVTDQKQNSSNSPDPTTWIPVFKVDSFETKEEVAKEDYSVPTPLKYLNSAGQQFETPITRKKTLCSFTFTQFEDASQKLKTLMDRNNTVNASAVGDYASGTLLLNVIGAEQGYYGGYAAWRVTYKCTYDPDTHDLYILDYGSEYKDGSGNLVSYMDKDGNYKIYGPLDGSTGAKASTAGTIHRIPYKQISFSFIRTS